MNGTDLLSIFGAVQLAIFVSPTILAAWKRHPYFWIILAVNLGGGILAELVLGWMFAGLGWLVAVILVLWPAERSPIDSHVGGSVPTAAAHPVDAITDPQYDLAKRAAALEPGPPRAKKTCPECGERVLADAAICRGCFHRFGSEPEIA